VQRNIYFAPSLVMICNGGAATLALADLYATLVLEAQARDFSTDAGNSALIVKTKSPLRLVALFISGLPGGEER